MVSVKLYCKLQEKKFFNFNNFKIFDLIFDFLLCDTLQPIPVIPGGGMIINGISKKFGSHFGQIQFTIMAYSFARCIVGLNYCFLYRYSCLCDEKGQKLFRSKTFKLFLFISGEILCISIAILVYNMEVDPEVFKKKTINQFPSQGDLFLPDSVYFGYDYRTTPLPNTFIYTCVLLAPGSSILNIIVAILVVNQLKHFKGQLTKKTYELHTRLIKALTIQVSRLIIVRKFYFFGLEMYTISNAQRYKI